MKATGTWLATAVAAGVWLAGWHLKTARLPEARVLQPLVAAPAVPVTKPAPNTAPTKFVCYFPESCYRLAEPVADPLIRRHQELEGRVFVEFIVDSLLNKHDFRIACARLTWKKTGRKYAADCQHLTTTQQRALLLLVTPLVQPLRFAPYRPDRRGCGPERWAMPVTFR